MLVIRDEQLQILSEARRTEFANRMVEHLRRVFSEWAAHYTAERLLAFVEHGVARARNYGFEVELDLARYLHVMHDREASSTGTAPLGRTRRPAGFPTTATTSGLRSTWRARAGSPVTLLRSRGPSLWQIGRRRITRAPPI